MFHEKLIVDQIIKFPLFYRTQRFIAVFTVPPPLDLTLSRMNPVQIPCIINVHINNILHLCPHFSSGLCHLCFLVKILYTFFISFMYIICPVHLFLLDLMKCMTKMTKIFSSLLLHSSPIDPNILLSTCFQAFSVCFLLRMTKYHTRTK